MQKQQYDKINELENEIQDLLDAFGNLELKEEVKDLFNSSKDKVRDLKNQIDELDNDKYKNIKIEINQRNNLDHYIEN